MRASLKLFAAMFVFMSTSAIADTPIENPSPYSSEPGFHFLIPLGITFGGDTLASAVTTSGDTKEIKGGELLQIGLGALYQFNDMPLALSLTVNYHFDSVTASNGDMKFKRYPVEVLAYYTGWQRVRTGFGIRMANSPEDSVTINGLTDKVTYENAKGTVLEVGFKLDQSSWINLRYVSEKYQPKTYTATNGAVFSLAGSNTEDGSHLGIFLLGEF